MSNLGNGSLKTALISTNDLAGGAARAAYRLHKGLLFMEQNSRLIVLNRKSTDDTVSELSNIYDQPYLPDSRRYLQKYLIEKNRTSLTDTLFSFPGSGEPIADAVESFQPDIINLHWVSGFVSVSEVKRLSSLQVPIVWTLHDQWPLTGGCHYSFGCNQFQTLCSDCPQVTENVREYIGDVFKSKLKYLLDLNITIVSPSLWLAEEARKSRLFSSSRIECIPNGLDTEIFSPKNKAQNRKKFGIPEHAVFLLFGCENGNEKRKGFSELLKALQWIIEQPESEPLRPLLTLGVFGKPSSEFQKINLPVFSFGNIHDDVLLSEAYSCADLFVLPSLEDNLPNTLLECMSCGIPVAAFSVGGIPDLVKEGITGTLALPADSAGLGSRILALLLDRKTLNTMSTVCRKKIQDNYSIIHQADKYLRLFNDLTKENRLSFGKRLEVKENICSDVYQYAFEAAVCEIENLKKKNAELENSYIRLQGQFYQNLTLSYLYCAENGQYDFMKFEKAEESCSFGWSEFEITYSLEKWKSISEFLWVPMWRSSCSVEIISAHIKDPQGQEVPLEDFYGNSQRRTGNIFDFYHSSPMLTFKIPGLSSSIFRLKGKWKVIDSHQAFNEYEKIRMESITLKNAMKRILRKS